MEELRAFPPSKGPLAETVPVFLNRQMGSAGCTMVTFETLANFPSKD